MYPLVQLYLYVVNQKFPTRLTNTPSKLMAPELLLLVILLVCKVRLDTEAIGKEWRDVVHRTHLVEQVCTFVRLVVVSLTQHKPCTGFTSWCLLDKVQRAIGAVIPRVFASVLGRKATSRTTHHTDSVS